MDEEAEELFKKASEVPPKVDFNVMIQEDRTIKLDEDKLERLDLDPLDMVHVIVEKIPDEEKE